MKSNTGQPNREIVLLLCSVFIIRVSWKLSFNNYCLQVARDTPVFFWARICYLCLNCPFCISNPCFVDKISLFSFRERWTWVTARLCPELMFQWDTQGFLGYCAISIYLSIYFNSNLSSFWKRRWAPLPHMKKILLLPVAMAQKCTWKSIVFLVFFYLCAKLWDTNDLEFYSSKRYISYCYNNLPIKPVKARHPRAIPHKIITSLRFRYTAWIRKICRCCN